MEFKHIVRDIGILGGTPIIRGTRISVEFILELVASGGSVKDIVEAYPQLSEEAVQEAINYAVFLIQSETLFEIKKVA